MNLPIKKALVYSGIFLGGLIMGLIIMNLLHMSVRPTYLDGIRTSLIVEQEFLAARSARQGNVIRVVVHRWNAVDTEAEDGFRVFRKDEKLAFDNDFWFPFRMLGLKWMHEASADAVEKGKKILEGINRGKLAVALEKAGFAEEAKKQWQLAKERAGRKTLKETKSSVFNLLEAEKTDLHLEAEEAVLGDSK